MSRSVGTSAQSRKNIPELGLSRDLRSLTLWAQRVILWWRERELSREALRPEGCVSAQLPSSAEDGVIVFATDLGVPVVSFGGSWYPLQVGGAL